MSQKINWANLTTQGRCKAPGVPWTEEELKARYELGMTAEEVRAGILRPEDRGKKEIISKDDLIKKAEALDLVFDKKVISFGDLQQLIEQKEAELKENEQTKEPKKKKTTKKTTAKKKLKKKSGR